MPERTKGYFTSHLAAVSKILHVSGCCSTSMAHANVTRVTMFSLRHARIVISTRRALSRRSQMRPDPNTPPAVRLPPSQAPQLQLLRSRHLHHRAVELALLTTPSAAAHHDRPAETRTSTRMDGVPTLHRCRDQSLKRFNPHINQQRSTWRS